MKEFWPVFMIVVGCFLVGSIPFGVIIGKCRGVDVRGAGSGNIGATNVGRTCGLGWGLLCFTLDFLKGLLPSLIAIRLADQHQMVTAHFVPFLAPLATVVGHVWTPWLKFKGGKGVATGAGAALAVAPPAALVALVIWVAAAAIWRYVSLASVLAAIALPITEFILMQDDQDGPRLAVLLFLAMITVFRHRTNLQRLQNGKEPKFNFKKEKAG